MIKTIETQLDKLLAKYGEQKLQFAFAFLLFIVYYFFYLSQDLFYVNGLNDFDEYFLRAQSWVNNEWTWRGGMDKLLSGIEYLALSSNNNDFMGFYHSTNTILFTLQFVALLFFVLKPNKILPNFTWKLLIALFLLSMPFFAFKNLTIEQSSLFTTMLVLFLVSYNVPYLGLISLLVYIARPESIIIFPLYILFWILDKSKRKAILINFITFLAFFFIYKYVVKTYLDPAADLTGTYNSVSGYSEAAESSSGFLALLGRILYAGIQTPYICILYAWEITQNYLLLILFTIGFVASVFNKKMYAFYAILLFYIGSVFALYGFQQFVDYASAHKLLIGASSWINETIQIANGREMEFHIFGHSRYRLPLYLSIAAFIIAGVSFVLRFAKKKLSKKEEETQPVVQKGGKRSLSKKKKKAVKEVAQPQETKNGKLAKFIQKLNNPLSLPKSQRKTRIALFMIIAVFIVHNFYTYGNFSEYFIYKNQMKDRYINDYYHMGFEIRKTMKPEDVVFMPGVCNCNLSFIIEFLVFSGNNYVLVPVCETCKSLPAKGLKDKGVISAEEIQEQSPTRIVFFDRYQIDAKKSFKKETIEQINNLYLKFDLNMLDSIPVKYVISPQELKKEKLVLKKQKGELYLYENQNIR